MNKTSKPVAAAAGLVGGVLNGLFGSGGGSVAVPILEHGSSDAKSSHAMAVALMFFISIVSAAGNIVLGHFPIETVKPLLPAGIMGASAGALMLRKVDNDVLRRVFGALLIYSGGRMLLK